MSDDREETPQTSPLRKGRVRRNQRAIRSLRPGNPPVEPLPPSKSQAKPNPLAAAAQPGLAQPADGQPAAAQPGLAQPSERASRLPTAPAEVATRPATASTSSRRNVIDQEFDGGPLPLGRGPLPADRSQSPVGRNQSPVGRNRNAQPQLITASADGAIPLQNVPLLSMKLGRWTVDGYSRAAVQSYWRIGEMKIGFDIGAHPWDFTGLPRLFITHAHLDHIAALPVHIARRRMMKMDPPLIYLPKTSVDTAAAMLRLFTQLDRGRLPCELIGVSPGDEIEISREYVVTASPTRHTVPSLAYLVWEKRRKLKPEFTDLTTDQIRALRIGGTEVAAEVRLPAVAYTGDTAPAGLDDCPDLYRAELLITEMTFLAPDHRREKIHKHGHMHLDDYAVRRDRFENEHIVCMHFSTRYHDEQCLRWFDRAFPDRLGGRLIPWLASRS